MIPRSAVALLWLGACLPSLLLAWPGGPAGAQPRLDKHEVTNREYAAFVAAQGRRSPGHWNGAKPDDAIADEPVVLVTFHDAEAYCAWAGGKRLPSVEEWQRSCRGQELDKLGMVWEWTSTLTPGRGGEGFRALCGPGLESSGCDCSHSYHPTWMNEVKGFRCTAAPPMAEVWPGSGRGAERWADRQAEEPGP